MRQLRILLRIHAPSEIITVNARGKYDVLCMPYEKTVYLYTYICVLWLFFSGDMATAKDPQTITTPTQISCGICDLISQFSGYASVRTGIN